jgi:subfamily B ATP-binding cassette protein MsbA
MRRFFPYFKYIKAVRWSLIGGILCGIIASAASGAGLPLMVKYVFPRIFDEHAARLTPIQLWGIAMWLPFVFTIRGVASYFNNYLIQFSGVRILEGIRSDFFRKMQELPLAFFQRISTGELITRGLADTNQLQNTLTMVSNDLTQQPMTLLFALGSVCWLALREKGVVLVVVSLITVPLCVFPIRYVGKKLIKRTHALQSQGGSITERFTENLAGVKEVRAFGLEQHETKRFSDLCKFLVRAQMKVAKYSEALAPTIEIISAAGISITFVYAYQVHLDLASFMAIMTALYICYNPIKRLGAINNELKRGSVSLERLNEILNEPVAIADPPHPVPVSHLQGDIAFDQVSFSYKESTPVLTEVSVHIPADTVCALVGPSGAGKTTFANLVPRFYDVTAGAITIDRIDVRAMRVADLRRNIAIVSQDPVLFNDTIYNNLLVGRAEATRDEVLAATQDAFAHDFITTMLPQGYDTIVGERGSQLSGGQKQRIAIARAFLRNAPILILDEATSALDSESEAAIQAALKKLVVGKTVIIIAHRFSTIRGASMILVFDHGRIVGQGSHAELYRSNSLYKSLYDRQAAQPALAVAEEPIL